jgi:apolipoprotein N-acyltransferase
MPLPNSLQLKAALFALLICGVLHGQTFHGASSYDGAFQIFTLATLAAALLKYGTNARRGLTLGLIFGSGWFLNAIGWVYISMHEFGAMAMPLAGAATVAFALYLASFIATACMVICSAWVRPAWSGARSSRLRIFSGFSFVGGFAGLITLAELARGYLFTGFPWAAIGYAHVQGHLSAYAPWVGLYGISFLAAALSAALAVALTPLPVQTNDFSSSYYSGNQLTQMFTLGSIGIVVFGAIAWLLPKQEFTQEVGRLSVSLIQPAIAQSLKFQPHRIEGQLNSIVELTNKAPSGLVVLPETAWPIAFEQTPSSTHSALQSVLASGKKIALGLPYFATDPAMIGKRYIANSVVLLDKIEQIGTPDNPSVKLAPRYDKHHLVPFGEFIPWGFRWFVNLMQMPLGDFNRGASVQTPFELITPEAKKIQLGFHICYEDLFGDELARSSQRANILVNVSNLAWFGESKAIAQHLQIARLRALELQKPIVRSTNTGATGSIDHRGQVLKVLPTNQKGILTVSVQAREGTTPYARFADYPALLLSSACVMLIVVLGLRRRAAAQ